MSIKIRCEYCEKNLELPNEAGGHRSKCAHCGNSNYVPAPVGDDELLDLEPVDEAQEKKRQQEVQQLIEQERAIIKELRQQPHVPLEQRQDLTSQDLHHLVVNYCLDTHGGNLRRADKTMMELAKFGPVALDAIEDFLRGKVSEPALKAIPERLLQGFLAQLRDKVKKFEPE